MNQKPLNKFRDKGISITIWSAKNGGYQCNIEKSYKVKDSDEWKKTTSYFPEELERLEKLCSEARAWIHAQANPDPMEEDPLPTFDDSEIPF